MPTIPLYNAPQVEQRPLPNVQQDARMVTPEALGAGAAQQSQFGKGMLAAGSGLSAIAAHLQDQANLTRVQEADAAYKDAYLNWQAEAKTKRVGSAAAGLTGDFEKWHDETAKKVSESLQNDAQRRAFNAMALKNRYLGKHDSATFELGEGRKAADASFEASVANEINLGAIAASEGVALDRKKSVENAVRAHAALRNWDDAVTQEKLSKALTEFHLQRFQNLVDKSYAAAKEYFNQNKGEIAGTAHEQFGKLLASAGLDTLGQTYADASISGGLTLEQALAKARGELSGKEEEHAVKLIRERYTEHSIGLQSAVTGALLKGASMRDIQKMPAFQRLTETNPEAAQKIVTFKENQDYTAIARAAASEARADSAEARAARRRTRDTYAAAYVYSDPEVLAGMSRKQVEALLPDLGHEHTTSLLNRWDTLAKNPAKLSEAKIDRESFNSIADEFNLGPYKAEKTDEDKARLGRLQDVVEKEISSAQQKVNRVLTRDEKEGVMRQVIARTVSKSSWVFWEKEVRAATVLPKELGEVVVPEVDRNAIILERQKRGKPTTKEEIAKWYLLGRRGAQ